MLFTKHIAPLLSCSPARQVVCAEDCEKHKPDPEPFLRAASTLGVDPARCRAFEDAGPQ